MKLQNQRQLFKKTFVLFAQSVTQSSQLGGVYDSTSKEQEELQIYIYKYLTTVLKFYNRLCSGRNFKVQKALAGAFIQEDQIIPYMDKLNELMKNAQSQKGTVITEILSQMRIQFVSLFVTIVMDNQKIMALSQLDLKCLTNQLITDTSTDGIFQKFVLQEKQLLNKADIYAEYQEQLQDDFTRLDAQVFGDINAIIRFGEEEEQQQEARMLNGAAIAQRYNKIVSLEKIITYLIYIRGRIDLGYNEYQENKAVLEQIPVMLKYLMGISKKRGGQPGDS